VTYVHILHNYDLYHDADTIIQLYRIVGVRMGLKSVKC